MSEQTLNLIKENEVRWVDLRFTDTRGKEQHVTIPSKEVSEDFFEAGKMFDGSSISGGKGINDSDMVLMPDADMDAALGAVMGSAYGCAGERCMAGAVLVCVGGSGEQFLPQLCQLASEWPPA